MQSFQHHSILLSNGLNTPSLQMCMTNRFMALVGHFGSVASFESRACVATGNDTKHSPEVSTFCQGIFGAGNDCNGGNSAWSYFKNTGLPTGGDYTDLHSGKVCTYLCFWLQLVKNKKVPVVIFKCIS